MPTFLRLLPLGFAVLAGSVLPLRSAGLTWDRPAAVLTAQPGQRTVQAIFHFRNTSSHPVTILAIEPSCRCVSAETPKLVWLPGEAGDLLATFTVGGQRGKVERSIEVTTDETDCPPTRALTLQINLPAK